MRRGKCCEVENPSSEVISIMETESHCRMLRHPMTSLKASVMADEASCVEMAKELND